MARIEISETVNERMITVWIEKSLTTGAVMESIAMAKQEIAKKIWEENQDKIMAQMDLKGLAALIAVEASRALKK